MFAFFFVGEKGLFYSTLFISLHKIILLIVPAPSEFVSLAEMEDTLLKNLFQGYQRWVRPIQHVNDTIRVRFGLKISQLVDVVRTHLQLQAHIHALLYSWGDL